MYYKHFQPVFLHNYVECGQPQHLFSLSNPFSTNLNISSNSEFRENKKSFPFYRMYDVDGNGVIYLEEMTKIVQAIYDMLGAGAVKPTDTAEERAKNIFNR